MINYEVARTIDRSNIDNFQLSFVHSLRVIVFRFAFVQINWSNALSDEQF